MSEESLKDVIESRYDGTSAIRQRALTMLANDDSALALALADKESSKILIKLLDGEDKQTIARQKNATDEKIAGSIGANIPGLVDIVISQMGGHKGLRGEADATVAPKEKIDIKVDVKQGELGQGEDTTLNYESLTNGNGA